MKYRKTLFAPLFLLLALAVGSPSGLPAADNRTKGLDMFIIIDGSSGLAPGKDAALSWLCDNPIDQILKDGDTVTIWLASSPAQKVYSGSLEGADKKDEIKKALKAINTNGNKADYRSALREARNLQAQAGNSRMRYTLIVSGAGSGGTFPADEEALDMLKYSRVDDHPQWRLFTACLDASAAVQKAARSFMN